MSGGRGGKQRVYIGIVLETECQTAKEFRKDKKAVAAAQAFVHAHPTHERLLMAKSDFIIESLAKLAEPAEYMLLDTHRSTRRRRPVRPHPSHMTRRRRAL